MSAATDSALAGVLALALAPLASAADWPEVPSPEASRTEWVSRHMIYNGVHMRSARFTTAGTPEEVEAFYKRQWNGEVIRNRLGHKTILGHPTGRHYITVDLEASGGGTQGTIGIVDMKAPPSRLPLGHGLARPANSQVINDIRYLDEDSPARTVLLHNTLSPWSNRSFYFRRLVAEGWRHDGGGTCQAASDSCVAQFTRPGAQLSLTFSRVPGGSGTAVMANQVDE